MVGMISRWGEQGRMGLPGSQAGDTWSFVETDALGDWSPDLTDRINTISPWY